MLKRLALAAFCTLLFSQSAPAALLVYEGYNGYGSGTLSGKTPNMNTVGLDQGVAYAGNGPQHYTLQPNSLAFSPNFLTSGGSVSFIGTSAVAAAQMELASPYLGTLYHSYLVNLSTFGSQASDGAQTRIGTDATTGGNRFFAAADNRNGANTTGVSYSTSTQNGTVGLTAGTTYLLIGRYTRVGSGLSSGNPGVATLFALTAEQYDSFLLGGGNDSYLDGATINNTSSGITDRISISHTSGTFNFQDNFFMQLVSVGTAGSFDEIRYGSSLADVTPIPEPGTLLGLIAASIGCGVWRGRRKTF
jgi:hypothetical protein